MNYFLKLKGRIKMRVIQEKNKNIIILQNNDNIEIKTMQRNPLRLRVSAKDGTLIINEISKKVNQTKANTKQN